MNGGFTANGGGTIWSGSGTGNSVAVNGAGASLTSTAGATVGASGTTAFMTSADGNTVISANNGSATVNVTNTTTGTTQGLTVGTSSTVLSGGTSGTFMTLNDSGATFSNSAGNPAQIHGVANGTSTYDAVNLGQMNSGLNSVRNRLSGGIASTAAMASIPLVENGKQFSLGIGAAGYGNSAGLAIGAGMRFTDNLVARASIAASPSNGGGGVVAGAGISYSW